MNLNEKILNQILANPAVCRKTKKMPRWALFQICKSGSILNINQCNPCQQAKEKNRRNIM